jgi:hypothetical protein
MFVGGLLSIVLATVNELFGLGIWESNGYPSLSQNDQGQEVPTTYGTFLWRFALVTVLAGVAAFALHLYLARREAKRFAAAFAEMDEGERTELLALMDADVGVDDEDAEQRLEDT